MKPDIRNGLEYEEKHYVGPEEIVSWIDPTGEEIVFDEEGEEE